MKNRRFLLWFIIFLSLVAAIFDLPKNVSLKFKLGSLEVDQKFSSPDINVDIGPFKINREVKTHLGLDLQGGTHLVLRADMEEIAQEDREAALEATKNIIGRRVDLYGVTEPVIQTSKVQDEYRVIVELPGIKNKEEAISLIGRTAQLIFEEPVEATPSAEATESAIPLYFKPTTLTGKHLSRSSVTFDPNTGEPQVSLEFDDEGAKFFEELTKKFVGKQLAIVLDNQIISAPRVNETISGGKAVIHGKFKLEEAKNLAIQLNAGALPVRIEIIEEKTIGATLGTISVEKSIRAGLIGLLMVVFFMWAYYGKLGFIANVALLIYGLLALAIFKLIPVTLTLPGIAGFILSIGMAVDANILIFERMKEELRSGKPWRVALELGFGRAWDSIKDANVTTLITCFILFNPLNWGFLNTSGMVRGFALTLAIGIFVSLFTGIVVTRTLLRSFYRPRLIKKS